MPSLVLIVLLSLVTSWGLLELSKYDPASSNNSTKYLAKSFANNIFEYSSLLHDYAQVNFAKLPSQVVSSDAVEAYSDFQPRELLDYQLVLYKYNGQTFLLNSWGSGKFSAMDDVLGELRHKLDARLYQSNNTFWENVLVGSNDNCILTPKSYIFMENESALENEFTQVCRGVKANFSVNVNRYVVFEQVFLPQ